MCFLLPSTVVYRQSTPGWAGAVHTNRFPPFGFNQFPAEPLLTNHTYFSWSCLHAVIFGQSRLHAVIFGESRHHARFFAWSRLHAFRSQSRLHAHFSFTFTPSRPKKGPITPSRHPWGASFYFIEKYIQDLRSMFMLCVFISSTQCTMYINA